MHDGKRIPTIQIFCSNWNMKVFCTCYSQRESTTSVMFMTALLLVLPFKHGGKEVGSLSPASAGWWLRLQVWNAANPCWKAPTTCIHYWVTKAKSPHAFTCNRSSVWSTLYSINEMSVQSASRFTQHATFQTFSVASFQVDWGNVPSGTSGSVNSAWRPQTEETIQYAPSKQHIDFCSVLLKQKIIQTPKHESSFVSCPSNIQCISKKELGFELEFNVKQSKYLSLFSVKHKITTLPPGLFSHGDVNVFLFSLPSLNQARKQNKRNKKNLCSVSSYSAAAAEGRSLNPPLLLFTATLLSAAFKPPSMWFSAPLQCLW